MALCGQVLVERGDLAHRATLDGVPAEFAPIVRGMNDTVDAFARPLKLSAEYVALAAAGEIPAVIQQEYRGQFDEMKRNWNQLIDVMRPPLQGGRQQNGGPHPRIGSSVGRG